MAEFVKVAERQDIPPGQMKFLEVDGERTVVANVEGAFFAFSDVCTHVGGPLSEGELEGDLVTCPWHGSVFNVKTGAVVRFPARQPVRTYPAQIEGDQVHVGVPKA